MNNKFLQLIFAINLIWSIGLVATGYQTPPKQYIVITSLRDENTYWDNTYRRQIKVNSLDEAISTHGYQGYKFEQFVHVYDGKVITIMSK